MRSNSNDHPITTAEEPEQLNLFQPAISRENLQAVKSESARLYDRYQHLIQKAPTLSRTLISYQGNKEQQFYRWFKFKEGFSHDFVKQIIHECSKSKTPQTVLDPFAGIGTTVTTSAKMGLKGVGIELLPVGLEAIKTRLAAANVDLEAFEESMNALQEVNFQDPNIDPQYFF